MPSRIVAAYRIVFALLATAALAYTGYRVATTGGSLVNFFSFFTIDSNILAVVVLAWGATATVTGRRRPPEPLRGAVVVYLMITGLVYALLLANLPDQQITTWANTIVHRIMPIVLILDWLFDPTRDALPVRRALRWLLFPLCYLTYTLLRGPIVRWYPYPFLDPTTHGYDRLAVSCVGVALGFVVCTVAVARLGTSLADRHPTGPHPTEPIADPGAAHP